MAMATWSCNGASSRRCNTASSQRYNVAARIATVLRRCCSTCRGSVVALLQHASRQHCCSSRRCGTIAAGAATMLRRYFSSHRGNAVALLLRRCCSSQQRQKAAHYVTMASGSNARGNGRQGYVTLQRWQVANVEFFCFFFTRQFQRENKNKIERKETGLRNLFPGSVGWQAPSC